MAGERMSFDRTPGIHGQLRPHSIIKRVQYDATSPWTPLSKAGRQRVSEDRSNLLSDTSRSQVDSRYVSQASNATDTCYEDQSNLYEHIHPRQKGKLVSETSILTTSTTRRQSVRDLFKYYGIERPTWLVSPEDTSQAMDEPSWRSSPYRRCHVCSLITTKNSVKCWRCGHGHCAECDALSPIQESRESHRDCAATISEDEMHPVSETLPKENTNKTPKQAKRFNTRPKLHSVQESTLLTPRKHIRSSTLIEPPSFGAQVSTIAPRKSLLQHSEEPRRVAMYSGLRVTTSVKESPFLKAEMQSLGPPLRCLPVAAPVHSHGDIGQSNYTHNHDSELKYHQYHHREFSSSPSSDDDEQGDERYREQYMPHNSRKHTPKTFHVHDESDHGYTADDSYIEEVFLPHPRPSYPQNSKAPSETKLLVSRPSPRSPCAQQYEVQKEGLVECYGYPKTGHERQGSVSSTGMVGECQHCLNDCECLACQKTEHNVRCCVHESHNRVIHHHGTPQKENTATPINFPPSPPRPPTPLPHSVSPDRTVGTVIKPHLQRKKTSPPKLKQLLKPQTPQTYATISPLKKSFGSPKSKKSTLMKNASQRPTPAPRVSIPRGTDKPTRISTPKESLRKQIDDPFYSKEPHLYPLPLFKERPALSPSSTNNKSSPTSVAEMYSSRASVRSGQDLRQLESYKWSSRRGFVIEGKRVKPPSRGGTSQIGNISPPDSTKASRRLSALFQLRERTPVPFLNQKLMEHQEQLRRMEKQCDEKTEDHALTGDREVKKSPSEQATPDCQKMAHEERSASKAGLKNGKAGNRKERLGLVEKQPSPFRASDTPKSAEEHTSSDDTADEELSYAHGMTRNIEEHRLSDDEPAHTTQTVEEHGLSDDAVVHSYQQTGTIEDLEMHECIWKRMFLEKQYIKRGLEGGQDRDNCIRGITVMLHFEGRDDFVFKGELSGGNQLIAVGGLKG